MHKVHFLILTDRVCRESGNRGRDFCNDQVRDRVCQGVVRDRRRVQRIRRRLGRALVRRRN